MTRRSRSSTSANPFHWLYDVINLQESRFSDHVDQMRLDQILSTRDLPLSDPEALLDQLQRLHEAFEDDDLNGLV